MVQHFLSSDETPHQYSQSFPGGFAVQGVRQPSLSLSPTIDPRLLTFEGTQPPFQHNDPSIPLSITTGGYFPHQSPVPSTSTSFGLWPDYQNDELSPSVSTPMSPTVDNVVSVLACQGVICCVDGLRVPPSSYSWILVSVAVEVAPVSLSANITDKGQTLRPKMS